MVTQIPVLLSELNSLLRLTQTQAMNAEARRAQATSKRVERELADNAEKSEQRTRLIAQAIRDLGGVPDVVGTVVGRGVAVAKASVEQGQPLSEALLGDLSLEHQLLERVRFAKMLAEQADKPQVTKVLDRAEAAHTANVEWLTTRLAEVALGGPGALRPTAVQTTVGAGRRLAAYPARQAAGSFNRSLALAERLQRWATESITTNVDRARQLVDAANEIWTAGRDASLERGEEIARDHNAKNAADAVHQARRDLGAVDADELPIKGYDQLNAGDVVSRLDRLQEAQDVRTILAYESANKNRKGVVSAAQSRLGDLAEDLVAAS